MTAILSSPLQAWHQRQNARMVEFAGMSLPIQYPSGIKTEHLAARASAALFDISHMVQISLSAQSGIQTVLEGLSAIFPIDFQKFLCGQTRYSFLLNDHGGILDDVMVSHAGDRVIIVANGARRGHDPDFLRQKLSTDIDLEVLNNQAFLALQGPNAAQALTQLLPEAGDLVFMQTRELFWRDTLIRVFRQGYSGEDGFEISLPAAIAEEFVESLVGVTPAGLGARDSLRLEAGLPLWGQDVTPETTPLEANLGFAIAKARRISAGFFGAETLIPQCATPPERSLVGLKFSGRQPARAGTMIHQNDDPDSSILGVVTSGGVSVSLGCPIALAMLQRGQAAPNTEVFAQVRGKMLPAIVTPLPFVPHRYYRGK